MGWSEGSEFAEKFINVCKKHVKNEKERSKLYHEYFNFLNERDWDTWNENLGQDPLWDKVIEEFYIKELNYTEKEMREELYGEEA